MSLLSSAFNPPGNSVNAVFTGIVCDPAVEAGDVVRFDNGVAVRALADSFNNSNVVGVVDSKEDATVCTVRVNGVSTPVYSGLDEAAQYYLSDTDPGKITTAAPIASGHVVLKIGQPFDSGRLLVIKGERIVRA